jgi:hypothetical protein
MLTGRIALYVSAFRPVDIGRPRRGGAFRQRACKPDPVASGHLSRRGRSPEGARSALRPTWTSPSRVDGPAWPCTGRGLPGRRVTTTPVRSYRTFSPLPVRGSRVAAPSAVCFCGTFPRLSPGGRYPPPCPLVSGLSSRGISLPPASTQLAPAMLVLCRPPANRRNSASSVGRLAHAIPLRSLRHPPCVHRLAWFSEAARVARMPRANTIRVTEEAGRRRFAGAG